MAKTLIYQVALGDSKLYDWCTDSVKQYAKRIDSEYLLQKTPILKIMPDVTVSNRNSRAIEMFGCLPIWEKWNAFDILLKDDKYDQVLIIDADVYIRDDAPNIFDELPLGFDFGGILETTMPITDAHRKKVAAYSIGQYSSIANKGINHWIRDPKTGYDFWNMGVMLINRSFISYFPDHITSIRDFILQDEFRDFIDGKGNWKWSTDQTVSNWWIRKEKLKTKNLDWKFNALYRAIEDKYIKEAHFVHFFLKSYLPGKGERVDILSNIIKR